MTTSRDVGAITEIFRSEHRREACRRVGIEVERVAFTREGRSLDYDAPPSEPSAHRLLRTLHDKFKWPLVNSSDGKPIGLSSPPGKVSLEPGSQLEFSSEPLESIFHIKKVLSDFEDAVDDITCDWGLGWSALGLNPLESPESKVIIPSPRYRIMSDYLPTRGNLALAMMRLSTSVQINLDYTSEEEGIEMLRVALLAAPLSYAMFGNSPIYQGKRTDFLSFRGNIWLNCDPDRSGMLPEVFEKGFDFESYAARLYRTPLMFAQNTNGDYVPARGMSLADISAGRLADVQVNDVNRMSAVRQLFTEARLKPGYIEVRSVDGQSAAYRYAATAFWMGLLYNANARALVLKRLGTTTPVEREAWFFNSIQKGMAAMVAGISNRQLAEEVLSGAEEGLSQRKLGEEKFLEPLKANVSKGLNPADHVVRLFEESCHEDLSCLIRSSTRCGS